MTKTYHFIGIKGSGMSALALMLHQMGHKVQGSDVDKYYFTQRGLEQAGISILPFDEKNIQPDFEIIAGNAFRLSCHFVGTRAHFPYHNLACDALFGSGVYNRIVTTFYP